MNLIKIKSQKFSPKRLFSSKRNTSKKSGSEVYRSDPLSLGSGSSFSSSSESSSSIHKPRTGSYAAEFGTPTGILPDMSVVWSEISTDTNFELVQAFKLIDRDKNGTVSVKQLEALLSRIGEEPPSEEELAMMLSEVDRNGDGCISLETLMSIVGSACDPTCGSDLRGAFDFFDTDHDGKITAQELYSVLSAIGDDRCTLDDCRRMIAGVDKNGDGVVCFEEFVGMMQAQMCS